MFPVARIQGSRQQRVCMWVGGVGWGGVGERGGLEYQTVKKGLMLIESVERKHDQIATLRSVFNYNPESFSVSASIFKWQ